MKTMVLPAALALGTALLSACPAQAADEFFVTITGAKQGVFHGESTRRGHADQILGLKYDYSATVPTSAGGQATGKVVQTPVVFEKEWGAATTQIYQALVTGETLRTVIFEFYNTSAEGVTKPAFRVTLTNAFIVSLRQHVGDAHSDGILDSRRYEDISLSFQKIVIEDETSSAGTTAGGGAGRTPLRLTARAQTSLHRTH